MCEHWNKSQLLKLSFNKHKCLRIQQYKHDVSYNTRVHSTCTLQTHHALLPCSRVRMSLLQGRLISQSNNGIIDFLIRLQPNIAFNLPAVTFPYICVERRSDSTSVCLPFPFIPIPDDNNLIITLKAGIIGPINVKINQYRILYLVN